MLRPKPKRLSPADSSVDSVAKKPRVDLAPKVVKPPESAGKVVKPPEHGGKGSKVVKPPQLAGKGIKTTASIKGASAAKGSFVRTPVAASVARPTPSGVRVAAPGAAASVARPAPSGVRVAAPGAKPAAPGARLVAAALGAKPATPGARLVSAPQTAAVHKTLAPTIGRFAASARAPKLIGAKGSGKVGGKSKSIIGVETAVSGKSVGKRAPVTVLPPKKVGVKVKPPPRSVPALASNNVPPSAAKGKGGKTASKGIPGTFSQKGASKNGKKSPFVHSKGASAKGFGKLPVKLAPKVVVAPRKVAPPTAAGKGGAMGAAPKVVAPPQRNLPVDAQEDPLEPLEQELVQEIRAFLDENGGKADGREVLEKFPEIVREQLHAYFSLIEDDDGDFLVSAVDVEDDEQKDRELLERDQEEEPWPEFDDEEEPQGEEQDEEYEMQADEEYEMQAQDGEEAEEEHAQNGEEAEEEYEMQEDDLAEADAEEGQDACEAEVLTPDEGEDEGEQADEAALTEPLTATQPDHPPPQRVIGAAIGFSAPSQVSKGVGKASKPKGGMLVLPPARTAPPNPQMQQKGSGKSGIPCKFFAKGACRNGTSCQFSHG